MRMVRAMSGTTPHRPDFLTALKQGALVLDGAMGTELYARGIPYTACFEALCRTQPELVLTIHQAYRKAGAHVLTSHSFGANAYRLREHGLADQVVDLNTAAVEIARQAADGAYVLGCLGPTGLRLDGSTADENASIYAAFEQQSLSLWDAGVDGLLLETFRQPQELFWALAAIRGALPDRAPVVACVSFDPAGTLAAGWGPEQVALRLAEWGANAIGVNCADGPVGVGAMLGRMTGPRLPRLAKPSAGLPVQVDGRLAYLLTPEDFYRYACRFYGDGIAAVGGCCGTSPDYTREIAAAARRVGGSGGGRRAGLALRSSPAGVGGPTEPMASPPAQLERRFPASLERGPANGMPEHTLACALPTQGGSELGPMADWEGVRGASGSCHALRRCKNQRGHRRLHRGRFSTLSAQREIVVVGHLPGRCRAWPFAAVAGVAPWGLRPALGGAGLRIAGWSDDRVGHRPWRLAAGRAAAVDAGTVR